jgi:cation:H+ antiporter
MPVFDLVMLAVGVACAGGGGEMFVRGLVGFGRWARAPLGIVGATLAAFATSSPELAVGVNAAIAGQPQLALGDALGSNVSNMGLILGTALLFSGMRVSRKSIRRELTPAIIAPILIWVLLLDGVLSRFDAVPLLLLFFGWMILTLKEVHRHRSTADFSPFESRVHVAISLVIVGLVLLILAGRLIVIGAQGIAIAAGLDMLVVGGTIVALATSTPELATVLIAKYRGHAEVGVGTILGSNIFNSCLIVSVVSLITPITAEGDKVAIGAVFGAGLAAVAIPRRTDRIDGRQGIALLALYGSYLFLMFFLK